MPPKSRLLVAPPVDKSKGAAVHAMYNYVQCIQFVMILNDIRS